MEVIDLCSVFSDKITTIVIKVYICTCTKKVIRIRCDTEYIGVDNRENIRRGINYIFAFRLEYT